MTQDEGPEPEFCRPVMLEDIGPARKSVHLEADPGESAALARRFDLPAIGKLDARLRVHQPDRGIFEIVGDFTAELVVDGPDGPVSLIVSEPLKETHVSAAVASTLRPAQDEEWMDAEPIAGDRIDLGELVAQHLALALDPALVEIAGLEEGSVVSSSGGDVTGTEHPFSVLETLRPAPDGSTA